MLPGEDGIGFAIYAEESVTVASNYYVNINDEYTSSGSGTSANPFTYFQWEQHLFNLNDDANYYVKGRTTSGIDTAISTSPALDHEVDISFNAWDLSAFGPPILYDNSVFSEIGFTDDSISAGDYNVNLTIDGFSFAADYGDKFYCFAKNIVIKNCYIGPGWIYLDSDVAVGTSIKFYGCTFASDDDPSALEIWKWEYKTPTDPEIEFYDCFFQPFNTNVVTVPDRTKITFTDCVFSNSDGDNFGYETPGVGGFPFTDCNLSGNNIFDFSATNRPTFAISATAGNESLYQFDTFIGLSAVDPQPALWETSGYDSGLFGNDRLAAGAFYFVSTPTPAYYVDINNLYTTSGTGTSASPFTYDQFLEYYEDNTTWISTNFYFRGKRTFNWADYPNNENIEWNPCGAATSGTTVKFLPWDLEEYGPWIISYTGDITKMNYNGFNILTTNDFMSVEFEHMVVSIPDFRIHNMNMWGNDPDIHTIFRNCYFDVANAMFDFNAFNPNSHTTQKLEGCTFRLSNDLYPASIAIWVYENESPLNFVSCYFDNLTDLNGIFYDNAISGIYLDSCVMNTPITEKVTNDHQTWGDIPQSGCTYVGNATLPSGTLAVLGSEESFTFTDFNVPNVGFAGFSGTEYSTGLFGTTDRLGAGAFYFNITSATSCELKDEYINICGPTENARYGGPSRKINLTDYLPRHLQDGDAENFLQLFEDFLNEMFTGLDGFGTSALDITISGGYESGSLSAGEDNWPRENIYSVSGTSAETDATDVQEIKIGNPANYNDEKISILEKIHRLTELHDPDLIDIKYIQFFARNLGYDINVSRNEVGVSAAGSLGTGDFSTESPCLSADSDKYLRFVIRNLPTWYKIKSTRNAINIMLYSFGLVGEFIEYYTNNYYPFVQIYNNDGSLRYPDVGKWRLDYERDLTDLPNSWFPTPHFAVSITIDNSVNISDDVARRKKVINAIESIRPINTVFRHLSAYVLRSTDIYVGAVMRFRRYIKIEADDWANSWSGSPPNWIANPL